MSKEITTAPQGQKSLTVEQIKTLTEAGIIPAGTPSAQVEIFAEASRQHGLSPFKKEIYLVRHNTKNGAIFSNIVGIDGYRIKAARTGLHAGTDDARFDLMPDGSFKTAAILAGAIPETATVTVYKIVAGVRVPFTHTATFREFYPDYGKGFSKANQMPYQMIAKVAEAFALKKAFPDEVGNLHIPEEIAAFEDAPPPANEIDTETLRKELAQIKTLAELIEKYKSNKAMYSLPGVTELFAERRAEIEAQ